MKLDSLASLPLEIAPEACIAALREVRFTMVRADDDTMPLCSHSKTCVATPTSIDGLDLGRLARLEMLVASMAAVDDGPMEMTYTEPTRDGPLVSMRRDWSHSAGHGV